MRTASIVAVAVVLALAGSSAALQLPLATTPAPSAAPGVNAALKGALFDCAPTACADIAAAQTDAVIARLAGLPEGVDATADAALALAGIAPARLPETRSATLEAAIVRAYAANGIAVDAPLRAEIARQAGAIARPGALIDLFDALADAQLASARILPAEDVAALRADLRTQMLQMTLQGDDALPTLLARADLTLAAAATTRVTRAMAALPSLATIAPVEGCGRALDLPFIQVGAPCDDDYDASVTNFVQIDYGGNDVYHNGAGAGIAGVGVGIAIDQGAGDDVYRATSSAQGFGLAGVGVLVDEGGSDLYNLTQFGQGFGAAGVGILQDEGDGNDVYESAHEANTIGTKAGGLGGIGVLRDQGGSEIYQQDGLDGFIYGAAGLGLLVDEGAGDDQYISRDVHVVLLDISDLGTFVGPIQVSAEVHGAAILYEEGGNDSYSCGDHVRQGCQGTGGVGAVALHLDLAGNDRYRVGESITPIQVVIPGFPSGQGGAYGEVSAPPGLGVGILRDLAGDDTYVAFQYAQGYATGGVGLLLDEGSGADSYGTLAAPLLGSRADGQTWADGLALGVGVDR